ncbi:MAG TPA: hypothetical protein VGN14_15275 [Candidatus Elarobacter sp.]|jgi:hypothetical protein
MNRIAALAALLVLVGPTAALADDASPATTLVQDTHAAATVDAAMPAPATAISIGTSPKPKKRREVRIPGTFDGPSDDFVANFIRDNLRAFMPAMGGDGGG